MSLNTDVLVIGAGPISESFSKYIGFDEDELNKFICYWGKQGFIGNEQAERVLLANSAGSNHMALLENDQRYVVYVTQTPSFFYFIDKTVCVW